LTVTNVEYKIHPVYWGIGNPRGTRPLSPLWIDWKEGPYGGGGYHIHAYPGNRPFHYLVDLREPKERYLFNLEKDRDMNQNIAETNPADLAVMEDLLKKSMDGWQLPEKMGGHSYTMPYIPFALKS